ncbi:MAG TPA: hypothetical protein VF815_25215 [Myxococcaceae bacterium]
MSRKHRDARRPLTPQEAPDLFVVPGSHHLRPETPQAQRWCEVLLQHRNARQSLSDAVKAEVQAREELVRSVGENGPAHLATEYALVAFRTARARKRRAELALDRVSQHLEAALLAWRTPPTPRAA